MARKCDICGKTITFGNTISHSHIKTRRSWKPNLQRVTVTVNGKKKRLRVCARCLKKGKEFKTAV